MDTSSSKLCEAFITAPKKTGPAKCRNQWQRNLLDHRRLMNVMCYLLWYQVLDSIFFSCFLGSESRNRAGKQWASNAQLLTAPSVSPQFKNCWLHIPHTNFLGNIQPHSFRLGLSSPSTFPSLAPCSLHSPLSARNQRHLRRLCTSLFCQAAIMFGMVPEGSAS